jgi:hypothetical protein
MGTPEVRLGDWTNGVASLLYGGKVGVTTTNRLNLDSLDRLVDPGAALEALPLVSSVRFLQR